MGDGVWVLGLVILIALVLSPIFGLVGGFALMIAIMWMFKRSSAVRWGVAGNMLLAWILTIPASALLAFGIGKSIRLFVS